LKCGNSAPFGIVAKINTGELIMVKQQNDQVNGIGARHHRPNCSCRMCERLRDQATLPLQVEFVTGADTAHGFGIAEANERNVYRFVFRNKHKLLQLVTQRNGREGVCVKEGGESPVDQNQEDWQISCQDRGVMIARNASVLGQTRLILRIEAYSK
jgi:hypothetical protein